MFHFFYVAKETWHLCQILVMASICTFQDCQQEALPKHYHFYTSSKEAIFQSGIRFRNIIQKRQYQKERGFRIIVDETVIKIGSELIWLWVAIEPKNMEILALTISKERNMFVAEHFLSDIIQEYGKHSVSTDGGTWYPQACRFLKLKHHIHSPREKILVEMMIQYIKDRTEIFDDYFPCKLKNCKMIHVLNWLNLSVYNIIRKKMA